MNTLQLQLLMLIFAGWVNGSQQDFIEYLQEENRVLREQLAESTGDSPIGSAVVSQQGPRQSTAKGASRSAPW
jgi:hypothetical protein